MLDQGEGTRRAPRQPAPVRREQILDAAITAFARSGFRDTSTAAIAAELGASEPTLFRHFASKRAIYLAALDRSAATLLVHWQEIEANAASPLEALLQMGQWYFRELQADSRHLRLRFRSFAEVGDPEVGERVREHFRTAFELIHRLYAAAARAGETAADTDAAAHAWLFMALGTLLDVTQITGMRQDLPLELMPRLMMLAAPKPSSTGEKPTGDKPR